jgi:hypothetical protein
VSHLRNAVSTSRALEGVRELKLNSHANSIGHQTRRTSQHSTFFTGVGLLLIAGANVVQALAVGSNELYVGCESGRVICGDLFLKNTSHSPETSVSLPARPAVLALAMLASGPGRAGSVVAAGAPCGVAVLSTFTRSVIGFVCNDDRQQVTATKVSTANACI